MAQDFLPYGRHKIEPEDVEAVVDVLLHGQLTGGEQIEIFENALKKAVNSTYAVACSNGTTALHLALSALDLCEGDIAIVPSITFLATANAARYLGAEVVFADVDPSTGLLGPEQFADAIKRCPKTPTAVLPVHLNGQSCDMEAIASIARSHEMKIVEDACHAIGTTSTNMSGETEFVGSCKHSDASCFSFHAVKTTAMGEGGAITTASEITAKRMLTARTHGMTRDAADFRNRGAAFDSVGAPNAWYYEMSQLGWNYRLTSIQAALGISQIKRLHKATEQRQRLAATYDSALAASKLGGLVVPIKRMPRQNVCWHLYVVRVDWRTIGIERSAAMKSLLAAGVGTQVHYIPVYKQPYFVERYGALELAGSEKYYESCLSLPLFQGMSDDDVLRVVKELERTLLRQ